MGRNMGVFFLGFILGGIVMACAGWTLMPRMMLKVHRSRHDFEKTVSTLKKSAEARGWKVPKVYNIQESLKKAGHKDMTRARILSICQPHHAYRILRDDGNKKVTAIMPCRIGVYETRDGQVFISEMNIGLMSKMFGGTIEEVMGEVAKEEEKMLAEIATE